MPIQKERIGYYDAIRGIACILVFLCHLLDLLWGIHNFVGRAGVCILFCLSGFFLTEKYHFETTEWSFQKIARFYRNRFFRIYPCLAVTCLLALLLKQCTVQNIISLLVLKQGWGHLWVIPYEIKFYIFFPLISLLVAWGGKTKSSLYIQIVLGALAFAAWVILVIPFDLEAHLASPLSFLMHLPMFMTGMVISYAARKEKKKVSCHIEFLLLMCFITYIFFGFIYYDLSEAYLNASWFFGQGLNFFKTVVAVLIVSLIIYCIQTGSWLQEKLKRCMFLQYIGRISYQIYLLHHVFLIFITKLMENTSKPHRASAAIVVICLTIVCADLMHEYMENRLLHAIRKRRSKI